MQKRTLVAFRSASVLSVLLLGACANQTPPPSAPTLNVAAPKITRARPTPPAMQIKNGVEWTANSVVVLRGRVVTMDDAGTVLENGAVVIRNGLIDAVLAAEDALKLGIFSDTNGANIVPIIIETKGVIYPGMIDLHNHPEYAIYPPMPIKRAYKDRYEWRNYDDDYTKRITYPNTVLTSDIYYGLGSEVGRFGELQALIGGTTTLQGSRTFAAYSKNECLARNIENSAVTSQKAFSRVDIGRDAAEWAAMQAEKAKGPMVIHLAEGASARMADELRYVKNSGLLGPELIAVHGVGLRPQDLDELAKAGAKMVWSPLSNFMLYAKTANIDAARKAGVPLSIGPDWAPSGSKNSLGELKVVDLVNKNALNNKFSDRALIEMVTRNPAQALNWGGKLGQIKAGMLADLMVMDDANASDEAGLPSNVYRNLIEATEEAVRLVMVRGEPIYGDSAALQALRPQAEILNIFNGLRNKAVAAQCPNAGVPALSVSDMQSRIQAALKFEPEYSAKKIPAEQIIKDLLLCGLAKPADPPTADDAKRALSCRFGLPFEATRLSPLTVHDDPEFFARVLAIPHMPAYLQAITRYYRAPKLLQ